MTFFVYLANNKHAQLLHTPGDIHLPYTSLCRSYTIPKTAHLYNIYKANFDLEHIFPRITYTFLLIQSYGIYLFLKSKSGILNKEFLGTGTHPPKLTYF